ncbi:MAG: class II aldolase [Deltaproteobacteria bacterium]|nr:MAG: class II aldolase [Deltaproteobacteria bacterium]
MRTESALRKEIVSTCLQMEQMGINQGSSGNVSIRWKDGMLITPSGLPYEATSPEDIIFVEFSDNSAQGLQKPSSEWLFHRDILASRTDIDAVIHTHSVYATAMAIQRMDIPAHHYMVAAAGGNKIQCARYATFGTRALSDNALSALGGRLACLLANHGVIALGPDLPRALWLANEIETLAKQFFIASQYGQPIVLPDEEMARVIERFKSYGPKKTD